MNAISAVLLATGIILGAALAYVVWFGVPKRDDNPDGSVQLPMNFGDWTDAKLKMYAMGLLMTGVLPFEQWANVFANPEYRNRPGLRAKAFSVWFPTMVDFLKSRHDLDRLEKELTGRGIDCGEIFDRADRLAKCFSDILSLYSRDEQIFIRDRRLQNVHGRQHTFIREAHKIQIFDTGKGTLNRIRLSDDEYRMITSHFYRQLGVVSAELIDRLMESQPFGELTDLYESRLKLGPHLMPLAQRLGIAAEGGG